MDALPKSAQPAAKRAVQDIYNAEDKDHARAAKVTKGAGSRAAALGMMFKLIESAQARWRAVNAPHLVALSGPAPSSNAATSLSAPRPSPH